VNLTELFSNEEFLQKLAGTLAWVTAVLVLRTVSVRFVHHQKWHTDEIRMRWHLRLGQATLLLLVLGVLVLWGSEIQAMALSAVAIAAAIVIALKELILCISGSIYRAASDCLNVGDRIEIGSVRGEVISYGLLTTTLLQIGPNHMRSGCVVVVPNSLLLSQPLVNETITDDYLLHTFTIHLDQTEDWQAAERILVEVANAVTAEHREAARRHMAQLTKKYGLKSINVTPRVTITVPEAGKVDLAVRVPAPAKTKGAVEQEITRRFLKRRAT
jgi:small-conductance mechanosensitive channel